MVTFNKVHTANRGTSTYKAEGYPGVILLAKPAFNGVHPEYIQVEDVPEPTEKASRAKQTPEERKAKAAQEKARLAGLTPDQRKEEKAAKLRAKLAALEAPSAPAGA